MGSVPPEIRGIDPSEIDLFNFKLVYSQCMNCSDSFILLIEQVLGFQATNTLPLE